MKRKLYIAYGSNLNLMQMAERCPTARVVGTSMLEDYQLVFCGMATIEPRQGARVPVAIWEIDEECEEALDEYEGFPTLYRKEYMQVVINGLQLTAMVYIMNHGSLAFPEYNYIDDIKEGYQYTGFDQHVLHDALLYTESKMTLLSVGEPMKDGDCVCD